MARKEIDHELDALACEGFQMEPWLSFEAKARTLTLEDTTLLAEIGNADPRQAHAAQLWFRAQLACMKAAGGVGNVSNTRFRGRVQGLGNSVPSGPYSRTWVSGGIFVYQAAMGFASQHLVGTGRYKQEHYDLLTGPWVATFGAP